MPKEVNPKGVSHIITSLKTKILKKLYGKNNLIYGGSTKKFVSAFQPRARNRVSFYQRYLDADTPNGFIVMIVVVSLLIASPIIYEGYKNSTKIENRDRFIETIIKDRTKDYPWLDREIDPKDFGEDDPTETDKEDELRLRSI